MQDFTFVHAADIHLDSPLRGLARYDGAPVDRLRDATRIALANLVQLAIDVGASFVVIAGDLYDGTWREMRTGLFAIEQFARLTRHGIRVFIVYGNHDAENRITKSLSMPDGVVVFGTRKCETIEIDELGVAIHGQSFKTANTVDNLAQRYCPPTPRRFNIALLHTALEGGHAHANYAPCSLAELASSGHDYWALGHVHDHAVLREHAHVVYAGNLQGRHARETGPKGAVVVRVEAGRVVRTEHHALDEVRWTAIDLNTRSIRDQREFSEAIDALLAEAAARADGRLLAARVTLTLEGPMAATLAADTVLFDAEIRAATMRSGIDGWIEKILFVKPPALNYDLPPVLEEILASAPDDEDCIRAIGKELEPLLAKLPFDAIDNEMTPLIAAAKAGQIDRIIEESRRLLALKLMGRAA